ncbi:hypothetical protein Tco_0237796 [Tanacetum coccineum]
MQSALLTGIFVLFQDNDTSQSKQNLQSSSMTFIHKTLILPSVLDSCFNFSTVCEVKDDRDVGLWGEADSETSAKKGVYEEILFKDKLHEFGGELIQFMHTTMVPVQVKTMKIQAGVQVSRPGELKRHLQLWKRFEDFIYVLYCTDREHSKYFHIRQNTRMEVTRDLKVVDAISTHTGIFVFIQDNDTFIVKAKSSRSSDDIIHKTLIIPCFYDSASTPLRSRAECHGDKATKKSKGPDDLKCRKDLFGNQEAYSGRRYDVSRKGCAPHAWKTGLKGPDEEPSFSSRRKCKERK